MPPSALPLRFALLLVAVVAIASTHTTMALHSNSRPAFKNLIHPNSTQIKVSHLNAYVLVADLDAPSVWTVLTAVGTNETDQYAHFDKPIPNTTRLLCRARHNASIMELGWHSLYIEPNATLLSINNDSAKEGYLAAGYLEGYITAEFIAQEANNFQNIRPTDARVLNWVLNHVTWMQGQSEVLRHTDLFWLQVWLLLAQVEGLKRGYNTARSTSIEFLDMFLLNFDYEIDDVILAVHVQDPKEKFGSKYANLLSDPAQRAASSLTYEKLHQRLVTDRAAKGQRSRTAFGGRHCSALIKITSDDLFVSHDTWSNFESMRRVYKIYNFGGTVVSLSGYPGMIASGDDWYQTSNFLAVQETTNEIWNMNLYEDVKPECVSEFIRVMLANYLSTSAPQWTAYFSTHNSGTYNNQYMVVDFSKYQPGSPIVNDTLWIAEQIPGLVQTGDVSHVLSSQSYWASYNIPYFKNIFDISGYALKVAEEGPFWSYTKYARPLIFARNHTRVTGLKAMQELMRYNDFAYDPLSLIANCTAATNGVCDPPYSAMLSIASRGDLNPPGEEDKYGVNWHFLTQRDHGATDSKIALWSERYSLNAVIISGPTNDQQPTFAFSTTPVDGPIVRVPPAGMPDKFNFDWVTFRLDFASPAVAVGWNAYSLNGDILAVVLGGVGAVVLVSALVFCIHHRKFSSAMQSDPSGEADSKPLRASDLDEQSGV